MLETKHFGKPVSEDVVERYWAIPQIVPQKRKLRILDVGAGYICSKLKAKGHEVVGMETAAVNIKHLKMRDIPVIPHDPERSSSLDQKHGFKIKRIVKDGFIGVEENTRKLKCGYNLSTPKI